MLNPDPSPHVTVKDFPFTVVCGLVSLCYIRSVFPQPASQCQRPTVMELQLTPAVHLNSKLLSSHPLPVEPPQCNIFRPIGGSTNSPVNLAYPFGEIFFLCTYSLLGAWRYGWDGYMSWIKYRTLEAAVEQSRCFCEPRLNQKVCVCMECKNRVSSIIILAVLALNR